MSGLAFKLPRCCLSAGEVSHPHPPPVQREARLCALRRTPISELVQPKLKEITNNNGGYHWYSGEFSGVYWLSMVKYELIFHWGYPQVILICHGIGMKLASKSSTNASFLWLCSASGCPTAATAGAARSWRCHRTSQQCGGRARATLCGDGWGGGGS